MQTSIHSFDLVPWRRYHVIFVISEKSDQMWLVRLILESSTMVTQSSPEPIPITIEDILSISKENEDELDNLNNRKEENFEDDCQEENIAFE